MVVADFLFGRDRELRELHAALHGAKGGRGTLALLVGEPGIGKTCAATVFAREAEALGARTTWGRAWEAGGAPAFWPWLEALRPLTAGFEPPASASEREGIAPLSRLLPELSICGTSTPRSDPAEEQFRIYEAVATFLAVVARQHPLVVVLDDVHAADLASLTLLHSVARSIHASRVLIVATYRDVEARLSPEVSQILPRIAREGRYLALSRLRREDLARWVAAAGRGDAEALYSITEGNPLFVAELLRLSRVAGQSDAQGAGRLPDGVRDVIRTRLAHLSPAARELLQAASVLGRSIDLGIAATLADVELNDARDLAREAMEADILVDGADRTAFAHILIREVLHDELAAARRVSLHALAGRTLAARNAPDEDASLVEAVHHLFAASPLVPAIEVAALARKAAQRAARHLAFDQAAELLSRALDHCASGPDLERCDLLLELATALSGAGQSTRGREAAIAAAAIARRLGDSQRLALAALRCGASYLVAVVDRALINLLEEALAALPPDDSDLRARLLARLAAARQPDADPAYPIQLAHEALAMSARVGDPATRREVLVAATSALAYFADPRERLALDRELIEGSRSVGDRVAVMRGLFRVVFDHLELGDIAGADRAIDEYDRLSLAANVPMLRWRAPMLRAMRALMQRRFGDSETLCAEAAAIAERIDDAGAKATLAVHEVARLSAAGKLDELTSRLPNAFELVGRMADPIYARAFRVGMLARCGRAAEVRDELVALTRHEPPLRGRPMLVWAADACLELGDSTAASVLAELLAPLAHRRFCWSPLAMAIEGPIADWVIRLRELAASATPAAALPGDTAPSRADARMELTRDGDVWTVRADKTFWVRDSRGMQILAQLVCHPGREFHVTDLLAPPGEVGHVEDAGDALDGQAIAAYKGRLEDLREQEAEALAFNDPARAGRLREEIDAIAGELARGVGLGGRGRKAASSSERARVNVRQRVKQAIERIAEHSPGLAKHLRQTVRTGTFCKYEP